MKTRECPHIDEYYNYIYGLVQADKELCGHCGQVRITSLPDQKKDTNSAPKPTNKPEPTTRQPPNSNSKQDSNNSMKSTNSSYNKNTSYSKNSSYGNKKNYRVLVYDPEDPCNGMTSHCQKLTRFVQDMNYYSPEAAKRCTVRKLREPEEARDKKCFKNFTHVKLDSIENYYYSKLGCDKPDMREF